ncbi:MAG: prolyl oligopeptidase family serine peptidase [Clostridia bacterium]|nr:prolyl oligopeptidase family serine peptidase [Clostridia bacterium]
MKKLLVLMSALLVFCLAFVSCGNTQNDGGQSQSSLPVTDTTSGSSTMPSGDTASSNQSTPTQSSGADTGSTTDKPSTDVSSGNGSVDSSQGSSSNTDTTVDTEGSTGAGSSTDTSVEINSSASSLPNGGEDIPPVVEPDYEPEVPDGPIDIAINGLTSYTVVYEKDNIRVKEFTEKFVNYMKETHKITFTAVEDSEERESLDLCIFVGNVKEAGPVKKKLNSVNDFGACVSGNDYVLYATNDRLYEFLYDALVEDVLFLIRNGNWSTAPKKDFKYSTSKYKDTAYVDYILEKQGTGISKTYFLPVIFEDRHFVATDGTELPYRLYVPYDYDRSKEYPVVLFLHGAGERGTNNLGNINHMFETLFSHENSPFWNAIIVAPQCPADQQWVDTPWTDAGYYTSEVEESNELKAVLEILDLVASEFPTDKDRYYAMGLSMGGFGTWDIIMRHSELFAAAVPLCGGGDFTQAPKLVDMPIWTIHGTSDYDVPYSGTRDMYVALKTLGSTVIIYEELENYSHNIWSYAAEKAEIWTWLFEQTKEGR